ncbi:MAG: ABC transporter permease, partial [Rhodospirillaceae bacterium]
MGFAFKVALRYLVSDKFQTALLVGGVSIGVIVFTFISALIGGLANFQIEQTAGSIAHVTFEPQDDVPRTLFNPLEPQAVILPATLRSNQKRQQIRFWRPMLEQIEQDQRVKNVSPQIVGNGILVRGQASYPVSATGVFPDRVTAISAIDEAIIEGKTALSLDGVLLGATLA